MARSPHLKKIIAKLRGYPVAVATGLLALVFAVLITLRASSLAALETEQETREQEWQRINSNLKRARDLAPHLTQIQSLQTAVADRLMDPEERAINYDYFYSLEHSSGVRLINLNQSGVVNTKSANIAGIKEFKEYQLIGYAISLEGSFEEVIHFLTALTNGTHFARLSGFTVSQAQKSSMGVLSINLQMQILGVPSES